MQTCNSGALDYIYFVHDASGILLMRLAALEKQRSTVMVTIPLFISPFFTSLIRVPSLRTKVLHSTLPNVGCKLFIFAYGKNRYG